MIRFLAVLALLLLPAYPSFAGHSTRSAHVHTPLDLGGTAPHRLPAIPDLEYAQASAAALHTPDGDQRAKCWGEWIVAAKLAQDRLLAVGGLSHVATHMSRATRFESRVQANTAFHFGSPWYTACKPVADKLHMTVYEFVKEVTR